MGCLSLSNSIPQLPDLTSILGPLPSLLQMVDIEGPLVAAGGPTLPTGITGGPGVITGGPGVITGGPGVITGIEPPFVGPQIQPPLVGPSTITTTTMVPTMMTMAPLLPAVALGIVKAVFISEFSQIYLNIQSYCFLLDEVIKAMKPKCYGYDCHYRGNGYHGMQRFTQDT